MSYSDLWEYDPVSDTWIQKASFPGAIRTSAAIFTIGTKAYMGTGTDIGGIFINEFWEYDQQTDSWSQKANFPNKGFIGVGEDYNFTGVLDFWEYDSEVLQGVMQLPSPSVPKDILEPARNLWFLQFQHPIFGNIIR